MQSNKIYSKYNYSDYYLLPRSKDPIRLYGLYLNVNKIERKLMSQTKYFKIEKIKNTYRGDHMNLFYDISSHYTIIDNVFGIGTTKMCRKLNYLAKKDHHAKILKLLYNFENLKIDAFRNPYSRSRKFDKIKNILLQLKDFEDISINVNFIKGIGYNYEYLIDYKGYKFSYHSLGIKKLIDYDNLGKKKYYPDKVINLSKVLDLIFDRFGKYMK